MVPAKLFVMALCAALLPAASCATADAAELFVFKPGKVCSSASDAACLELGDVWNVDSARDQFVGIAIEHSNECDGPCFIAGAGDAQLQIFVVDDRIYSLRSYGGAKDARGNSIGDKLTAVFGQRASCIGGENDTCRGENGVEYLVGGCDHPLVGDMDRESVLLPVCAAIDGLQLRTDANTQVAQVDVKDQRKVTSLSEVATRHRRIYERCGETEGFPGATAACVREQDRVVGAELEQAYDLALSKSFNNAQLIRESQRHWLRYQAASCAVQRRKGAESVFAPADEASCLLMITLTRLEELKGLAIPPER